MITHTGFGGASVEMFASVVCPCNLKRRRT